MSKECAIIMVGDVEYVPVDSIKTDEIIFNGDNSVASVMVGKPVIVRSYNAGINIGIVEVADETGVVICDARRIYYHRPKDKSLSWYEGVAVSGLSESSKISGTVKRKVIIEKYELTEVSLDIYNLIMEKKPNAQS